jgi:isopenicillin-N N-acyltransferase-like protein
MKDYGFPVLRFNQGKSYKEWGSHHGESYREAIRELVEIRRKLLAEKNPKLVGSVLDDEAKKQWIFTAKAFPTLFDELEGIRSGAKLEITDIVVLNAYTDIRDIEKFEDNDDCSTVFLRNKTGQAIAGQTWDMHASAKNFLCVFDIPEHQDPISKTRISRTQVLSILGTVGLMGFTGSGEMIGVNNLNASGARSAVIWPVLVRAMLKAKGLVEKSHLIKTTQLTSARCFMLGDKSRGAEVWEVFPDFKGIASRVSMNEEKAIFHTNHCLMPETKVLEAPQSNASTTRERYSLLESKLTNEFVQNATLDSLKAVLQNHDGFPKSICSHFQSGATDPSHTCGGALGNLSSNQVVFWRGCSVHEPHLYREHFFNLDS